MPGILVVEDDENLNRGITFSLKKSGYEVFSAESVKKSQHFQLRFCQTDFTTLYQDFHFSCDKYDISRNHLSSFRFLLSATEICFYFQKKYRKTKRLCNIIICPCFISHDLIHLLI